MVLLVLYFSPVLPPVPIMLLKSVIVVMLLAILASLGSALVFLFRDHARRDSRRMLRALTWRIALSLTLFLLLMAGFYFGIISPHGLAPK